MDDAIKESFKKLCKDAFDFIKVNNPRIRSIVIQYNDGNIYVGNTSNGCFTAAYYIPIDQQNQDNIDTGPLTNLMSSEEIKKLMSQLFEMIIKYFSEKNERESKIKSYNIFYEDKTQKINICRNTIGSRGVKKSRIFPEF